MYKTTEFIERYTELETWAISEYGSEGVKAVEQRHPSSNVRSELPYFRHVRNLISHNPNGSEEQMVELTDAFRRRFERLCHLLMDDISKVAVPYSDIYKRDMTALVMPTVKRMKEMNFTHVPVIDKKKVWGVFSESTLFKMIADGQTEKITEQLTFMQIGKYITDFGNDCVCDFIRVGSTIDEARTRFTEAVRNGLRLDVLFVTTTGDRKGDLTGLVTIWDITSVTTSRWSQRTS